MTKKAFTLAEVLITLGIIGIVAAMTIPTLLTNIREKQTVSKLKQTYSMLSQAFKLVEDNGGVLGDLAENDNISSKDRAAKFMDLLRPHLKILVDCGHNDTNEACVKNQAYIKLNNQNRENYANKQVYYKVVLFNGTHIILRGGESGFVTPNGDPELVRVYVDTNGTQGPNQWGRDFFMFHYYDSYGFVPAGIPTKGITWEQDCENTQQAGLGCAYKVLKDGRFDYLKK